MWWDDYGFKSPVEEKLVTTVKMMGIQTKEKREIVTVMVGGKFWSADLITK